MAVRQDKVQIEIEFITDASKAFAKTVQETEKYRGELKKAQSEVAKLAQEEDRLAAKGKDITQVAIKRAEAEKRVQEALSKIATTGKDIEKIDLSKLMPSQLVSRAAQLRQTLQFIPESHPARVQMESDLKAINTQLAEMNGRTKGVASSIDSMRQIAAGVFLGGGILGMVQQVVGSIKQLVTSSISAANQFEQARISFETMLGSSSKAQKLIGEIQKLAATTPFETDELTDYSKRLLAMGITADGIIPTMTALGNIAAGVGKEKLPQLVLAFGQVQTKTKLAGGELKQFVEAGVPLVAALAKQFNVAEAEIFKMSENGKISFKNVEKAIFDMSAAGGKFENLMVRQSKTLGGLWSTFKDNFTLNVLIPLGESISKIVRPILETGMASDKASVQLANLKGEFNVQIEVLKNGNLSHTNRIKLIDEINSKYKDYLPALLTEKSSIEDITKAQTLANSKFMERIAMMASQESLIEMQKKVNDLTVEELKLAERRERVNQNNVKKQGELFTQQINYDSGKRAVLNTIDHQIAKNKTDQEDAIKSLQRYADAAKKLGVDVSKFLNAPEQGTKTGAIRSLTDPKEAEKQEKDRLKRIKDQYDILLKESDLQYKRESLLNEIALLNKQKTESEANKKELELKQSLYNEEISLLTGYLQKVKKGSEEYVNTQIKILETEKKIVETRAALQRPNGTVTGALPTLSGGSIQSDTEFIQEIDRQTELQKAALQRRFDGVFTAELDTAIAKQTIQSNAYAQELAMLEAKGLRENAIYKQIADKKKGVDQDLAENKKRLTDYEIALDETKKATLSAGLNFLEQYLGRDEASRRKHATLLKAFQIGEIVINGVTERQKIFAAYAAIPGGQAIAAPLALFAAIRSGIAVASVLARQFYVGGFTGQGLFKDNSGKKVAGVVHDNEYVIPDWMVNNPKYQPTIAALENDRLRGFALGGFVDTTPRLAAFNTPPQYFSQNNGNFEGIARLFDRIERWATEIKVQLPLTDLEKAQYQKSLDLLDAQY